MFFKLIIFCMMTLTTSSLKARQVTTSSVSNPGDSTLIAFASDTQAPMWVETLWLKANNNRTATKKVFNDVMDRGAGSLFLLGDVVNLGYSNRQWKPIDGYLQSLRNKGVGVNAILGNHEVMGLSKLGQKKFQSRFPNHVRTGYVQIKDSVAVVLLNSNFKNLSAEEDAQQTAWYKSTLEKLDADPSIQYVITTCHHSPYTNSKIVGCSKDVQQRFVPAFLQSKKSQLFLSGHCHGFEHYQIQGKDFMVIGGGGGLHQPLKQGAGCLPDLAKDYKPLFHYLTVKRMNDHLQVTSYRLKDDFSGFEPGLEVDIKKPGAAVVYSLQAAAKKQTAAAVAQ